MFWEMWVLSAFYVAKLCAFTIAILLGTFSGFHSWALTAGATTFAQMISCYKYFKGISKILIVW